LWTVVNERDVLGRDLIPDYVMVPTRQSTLLAADDVGNVTWRETSRR
jgi:hypothetical protein